MAADILVLKADPSMGVDLRQGLEAADYTVDLVVDGRIAAQLVGCHSYRAVLMDIPESGSIQRRTCSELRKRRRDVPILVLTEKGDERDEVEALDAGADDYLRTPCSREVLLARLRALTRRGTRSVDRTLRIGDLWLDPVHRRCGRRRRDITLTAREFAVLALLARHPGKAVSKRMILDEVWDTAYRGNPAVVDWHICMLRRKIDAPFGVCSVETVRGFGYRLTASEG
ncbi:response regulator transcription factor [Streptomyces heilongjiangensis]|uniref:Response regulator transcription factor n=1 Tax=Streptomyces heilongjiangensis TaxID=945052 RepID=A0ABW1BFQ1_9ACTN|nr:response regulator transcription factor [Streptomyces heilongjiangensis]MDC2950183.1 response regulator transcription factor [Streptomyces heilongjiangensis]